MSESFDLRMRWIKDVGGKKAKIRESARGKWRKELEFWLDVCYRL